MNLTIANPGCLIGILTMVYYNPYITGSYNPLYTLNNQVFFIAQLENNSFLGSTTLILVEIFL